MLTQEIDMYILLKVQGLVVKGILLTDSHKKKKTCNEHKRHYIYKTDIFFFTNFERLMIYNVFKYTRDIRTSQLLLTHVHVYSTCNTRIQLVYVWHCQGNTCTYHTFTPLPIWPVTDFCYYTSVLNSSQKVLNHSRSNEPGLIDTYNFKSWTVWWRIVLYNILKNFSLWWTN